MHIVNHIAAFHDDMTAWRRDIHAHPETAFEERRTAALVAEKLRGWGIEVHEWLAKTGVVGTLRGSNGHRAIGLRADMDALPMEELNDFPHRSTAPGKFHGCGHDGHTSMLLGAARHLAETRNFDGTVYFIFQPEEENVAGAGPAQAGRFLHNPRYDFNDAILPIGASYWARLVEAELPRKGEAR